MRRLLSLRAAEWTLVPLLFVGVVFAVIGCGGVPVPTDKLTNTGAAIRAAKEVGAGGVPQAALHLKLAEDQTEQAKKLVKEGENERATAILARAEADAELAVALAREAALKLEAQKAQERVRNLNRPH